MKNKTRLMLFLTFAKIGLFTFGGGYAMIPLIQRETVERKKWINDNDILDIVAIAESTPGPIAINTATFVGYKVAGVFGAAAATIGTVIPSFAIIFLVTLLLAGFEQNTYVKYALEGIRAGVLALIIRALVSMYKQCPKSLIAYCLMGFAFVASAFLSQSALIIIACCAAVGIITNCLLKKGGGK